MAPPPRLRIIKEVAERLGLGGLAEVEMALVRERPPPARLIAALVTEGPISLLTEREHEIMALLSRGYTRQEIAADLGVTHETVKHQLKLIFRKLNARNSIEAVNIYLDRAA